ncbi:type II secretion system F family protein [Novosphingobium pentaromativorans]|uniref:Tight adherence protein C n=1 Tax=Novosphingobium pentaromativorans US6-1 TaxID=1088721 RepID=G6EIU5_9SPHN|nr:type II secretion system F family protein [Novosphingobium pentaromativorans]AIT78908.1 secretion system protein [Novosphingobium pentaromativorans US6-1]EHJ58704.1 tight adherence protein C [Novosphingobium pentaromativorans US6-1]
MVEFVANNALIRNFLLLLIFALVVGVTLAVMLATSKRSRVRTKLEVIGSESISSQSASSLRRSSEDAWSRLVARIEKAGLDLGDTKSDALTEQMQAAGFESPAAARVYTLVRLVLVVVLPTAMIGLLLLAGSDVSYMKLYFIGAFSAVMGLYVPNIYVRARAASRRREVLNGFPDALDLMLVCVEAGLGLEAAFDRVGREMVNSHPLVSRLLVTTTLQLRAGATRESALRNMAAMARIDEIASFATLLIQSDKLGTSIAMTLRVYASEMREKRRMRAEEKAHRIPVLISIPLVACMLPTMIGTLMLPAAIRVVRILLPTMTGG